MVLQPSGTLAIGDAQLEYRMIGPAPDKAPTIVMLHEGLGSVGLWATGAGVFVYSRAGYGRSSRATLPRPLNFMEIEALDVLPKLLDVIGFRRGLLFGHSDGASIATIYAGGIQDHRVRGVILIAPHFMVEDFGLVSINKTRQNYDTGDLKPKLARWHDDVDNAQWLGGVWLDPNSAAGIFRILAYVRVRSKSFRRRGPVWHAAYEIAQEECYCPVDVTIIPVRAILRIATSERHEGGRGFCQPAANRFMAKGVRRTCKNA